MAKTDDKLLSALRSSSLKKMNWGFEGIYKKYAPLIFYIALKEVRNKEDAEDIVSNIFLCFFECKNRIKNGKAMKYYLVTSCKNACRDLLKNRKKEESLNGDIPVDSNIDSAYEEHIAIFRKFLDEEEIEYIILHTLYGFTFQEIAKEKNMTCDAISSKYYRAIKKAKEYYKKEGKNV